MRKEPINTTFVPNIWPVLSRIAIDIKNKELHQASTKSLYSQHRGGTARRISELQASQGYIVTPCLWTHHTQTEKEDTERNNRKGKLNSVYLAELLEEKTKQNKNQVIRKKYRKSEQKKDRRVCQDWSISCYIVRCSWQEALEVICEASVGPLWCFYRSQDATRLTGKQITNGW